MNDTNTNTNTDPQWDPATNDVLSILAFRHMKPGDYEFTEFTIALPKKPSGNTTNDLLVEICSKRWHHNPPADLIADYLRQTRSYGTLKAIGLTPRYAVINFYEKGADRDKPQFHACREIAFPRTEEAFREFVAAAHASAKADPGMQLRDRQKEH